METNRDNLAGPPTMSAPPSPPTSAHGGRRHKRRPGYLYRLFMHTPLMEPFRHVLRPLVRWAWRPHLTILGMTERVNLKPPSTFAMVMSILLGPLIFLMLLPLILILIPVGMVVGVLAVLATSVQVEAEEPGPHSMNLHVLD